ncbi:MAG TPA: TetR family transcriptional regulator [Acidimicrobiales bacterium]
MAHTRADGRRERWRDHRQTRRVELMAAVIAAVPVLGPRPGLDDIAAHSGIAKPVFYRYFADKADLYLAVGRTVAETVVTEITDAINREATPDAMLAAGIDAYLSRVEEGPELYRFVAHPPIEGAGDPLTSYATVVGLHVSRVIGDFLRAGGLDSGAAEPWGFGLVGMVRAAAERWLEHPTMSRQALSASLSQLAWSGLGQVVEQAGGGNIRALRAHEG